MGRIAAHVKRGGPQDLASTLNEAIELNPGPEILFDLPQVQGQLSYTSCFILGNNKERVNIHNRQI